MKTALQELMQWMEETEFLVNTAFIKKIDECVEKEKEQIIDAYYGNIDGVFGYREEGQEYYNQTYNQN